MPKRFLNETFAASVALPAQGEAFYWDTKEPKLGLKVRATGRKVFVFQYRPKGSRSARRVTIGQYVPGNALQARTRAKELAGRVALGEDPAADAQETREAQTVAELFPAYLEWARSGLKPRTLASYEWYATKFPASLAGQRVRAVSRADVGRLHASLKGTPTNANRVVATLSAFLTWAIRMGHREGPNPCEAVPRNTERPRKDKLTPEQKINLWAALEAAEREGAEPGAVQAIRFLFFTGLRPGEAFGLTWGMVASDLRFLHLPDTKTGPSVRPLSVQAQEILLNVGRGEPDALVFARVDGSGVKGSVKWLWSKLRERIGLPIHFRLYTLRHGVITTGAALGFAAPLLGQVAGQRNVATTQRYINLSGDEVAGLAADAIGQSLAASLTPSPVPPDPPTGVLPFPRRVA